jgi:uncharacterized protein (TIGR00251 family)
MILTIYVKPNARENKITQWVDEDTLSVSLTATPEKGKANAALLKLLAKEWGIAKSEIEITRGAIARIKQLTIDDKHRDIIQRSRSF